MQHNWKPIISQLKSAGKILLTTHVNPDGDGIGSEIAMYHFLLKMNIISEIINSSAFPEEYAFLDPEKVIQQYIPERDFERLKEFDLIFIFDVGGITRTGILGDDLARLEIPSICIDHHPENHIVCDYKVVDDKAPSTTCLVYELIKEIGTEYIDKQIAEAVYVGLMTDTGSFRFENANKYAFRVASELLEYDIKPNDIFKHVYESYSRQRMALLGTVLQTVHYENDEKLAWFTISRDDLKRAGVQLDEIGGYTDFIRSIKGVEVSVMFLEIDLNKIRVSFRSKGKVVVNQIARKFGGGGHFYAAGLTVENTLEKVTLMVLPEARKAIEQIKQ
ncbi:bifunctional oligoribonuclease/PAP phosphatase NrnA [bacterium]|nr:bifunctional oligoribonuclease/PAP phosphatase NrnA [bacterium]MBU1064249.1 bifunctional oligoribonuclease/PAP phosphatase NrnA [bacterium]MBU1635314.1 bifunctional oligoribonuclease/PAP phosphatase NrnA [bacterium]MBU1874019.1 bifunctional oligoribonuclease/PAP phosphatase NrnA [bacterium]